MIRPGVEGLYYVRRVKYLTEMVICSEGVCAANQTAKWILSLGQSEADILDRSVISTAMTVCMCGK